MKSQTLLCYAAGLKICLDIICLRQLITRDTVCATWIGH
jgi:hypothetical protein